MSEQKVYYGYYSRKQEAFWADHIVSLGKDQPKVVIYLTPDRREIECTLVDTNPNYTSEFFDDFVSLGPVVKYLRSRKPITLNSKKYVEIFGQRKNK